MATVTNTQTIDVIQGSSPQTIPAPLTCTITYTAPDAAPTVTIDGLSLTAVALVSADPRWVQLTAGGTTFLMSKQRWANLLLSAPTAPVSSLAPLSLLGDASARMGWATTQAWLS